MAIVTLKDLMDPLSKIQAATERSATALDTLSMNVDAQTQASSGVLQKLDRLIKVNSGVELGAADVQMLRESFKQTKLLEIISKNKGGSSKGKAKGGVVLDSKSAKEGGEALIALGAGAYALAKGMIVFSLVPKKGISKFKNAVFDIYDIISMFDTKQLQEGADALATIAGTVTKFALSLVAAALLLPVGIIGAGLLVLVINILLPTFERLGSSFGSAKKGAETFATIASSISKFAIGLALSAVLLPIGIIGAVLLVVAVNLLIPTFERLGSSLSSVEEGAEALAKMGGALFSFAKGLVVASLAAIVGIIGVPFLVLSMVLIGGAFYLLGTMAKPIKKGAKALDKVGDALKSFAIGIAIFALVTFAIMQKPIILLAMVATLLLIGGAMWVLGKMSKAIGKGAMVLGFVGLALIIFSLGYVPFALVTNSMTLGDVALQGAILLMLGLEFAAAGFAAIPIAAGAVAFGLAGLALIALAPGVKAIKGMNMTEKESLLLKNLLRDVKKGFIGEEGLLKGGAQSIAMGKAALSFEDAGAALIKLAPGLKAFNALDWTAKKTILLTTTLAGISTAFASAGGEPVAPGGLFGKVFGNTFSPNATERGIDSVMDAGKALTKIAGGLMAFQKLIDSGVDFGDPTSDDVLEKKGTMAYAVMNTIGFIQTAFGAVGDKKETVESGGFFSSLLGIKSTRTEEGIRSVKDAGKALTGIAKSLMSFQSLIDSGVDFGDPNVEGYGGPKTLAYAVINTIGFVNKAFAQVAENKDDGGWFGFSYNKVEEGIDMVKDAGKVLTNIANSLTIFQELITSKVEFGDPADPKVGTLAYAVINTIGFVNKAFAQVADAKNNDDGGWFGFSYNKVEEGIEMVEGAGDVLQKIAASLTTFSGIENVTQVATNIKDVLTMVTGAFASIGGDDSSFSVGGISLWSYDDDLVQKGIAKVEGAGDALADIATGVKAFEGFDSVAVATSIGTLLTSIGTTFSTLYETNPEISPQLQDFATFIVTLGDVAEKGLLDKAAEGISKIADSINSIDIDKTVAFGDLFKHSADLSTNKSAYKKLAQAVEDIRDMMESTGGGGGGVVDKVTDFFKGDKGAEKGADGAAPAAKGADSSKQLNATLASLSKAITNLPMSIATMELTVSPR